MPVRKNESTAADIFTYFNVRACQILNSHRHLVVVDPHLVHVTLVHQAILALQIKALDGFNLQARMYSASVAVKHYIQMYSSRTARRIAALSSDGMRRQVNYGSVAHCVDNGMYHVSHVVPSLLESYAVHDDAPSSWNTTKLVG